MKTLRLTEFCNFPEFTWLVSDRAGTRTLVWIPPEPTLLHPSQPEANLLSFNSFFFSLLHNVSQEIKKKKVSAANVLNPGVLIKWKWELNTKLGLSMACICLRFSSPYPQGSFRADSTQCWYMGPDPVLSELHRSSPGSSPVCPHAHIWILTCCPALPCFLL